jgi:hypothetical protein
MTSLFNISIDFKALAVAWLNKLLAIKELNILAVILADS